MADRRSLAAELAASWFGSDLPPHARTAFLELAVEREVGAGTEMVREGQPTTGFGLVLSGRVALRLHVPGRGQVTILTVEPGDIYGWTAEGGVAVGARAIVDHGLEGTEFQLVVERHEVPVRLAVPGRHNVTNALAASLYPRVLEAVARRLDGTRLQLLDLFAGQVEASW